MATKTIYRFTTVTVTRSCLPFNRGPIDEAPIMQPRQKGSRKLRIREGMVEAKNVLLSM